MICPNAEAVELFVAGRLADSAVAGVEAHLEECEECFLRIAAAAGDASEAERVSLSVRASAGSRAERYVRSTLSAPAQRDHSGAHPDDGSQHTIGPYLVTGLLGMGGMSIVYRAKHQTTGREVALKTVRMPRVASYLGMLRQEIEFLQSARHPGIVTIVESDLIAGDPWYAMELFNGPTLEDFNRQLWKRGDGDRRRGMPTVAERERRRTPVEASTQGAGYSTRDWPVASDGARPKAAGGQLSAVLRLFARLCDPIGFIHGSGMVHGDIKPLNIFLRGDQPVLMDFGLASQAKGTVGREALDVTGRIRGTLPYIAPETIRGQIPDARADLYALGCMLYESLVGAPPFVSRSGTKIIDMHLALAPEPARMRVSGVPPELDQLLLRLLAKNPRERFGHASALATTLASIADELEPAPPGRAQPIISSATTMPLFRPPLVGRDRELGCILDLAHRSRVSSGGGMFLVAGESGIGKTFFTSEVAQRALLAGIQVITCECVPLSPLPSSTTGTLPLQPLRRFFQALRDRCRERGPQEVDRLFGPHLELLATYLPSLASLRRPGEAPSPPLALPAGAARDRIVAAVVDTLSAYALGRPLLLALDDLQWADELTLAVLDHLDQELFARVPLVVVGTYRSDEASDAIRRLVGRAVVRKLDLKRLDRAEIDAMVGGMLSMAQAPAPLCSYVHAHAEGVPFFVAEYLRALVSNGVLTYRGGEWTTRAETVASLLESGAGTLPRTLQDLIRGRIARLSPEIVETLEAGALVGRRFSEALVARMLERPVGALAAQLGGLGAAQLIESDGFDGHTFLHDKIRETLYAGLDVERRQRLHLAAARAMADDEHPSPDQFAPMGHHFRLGGDVPRAIVYLEKAGEHALAMAANADADRYLREALDLEVTLPARLPELQRARWQRLRGEALKGLGQVAESADALKASAALLSRPFPRSKAAFAGQLMREIARQIWHRLRPQAIRRPTPLLRPAVEEAVQVFDHMHQASYYLGRDADLVLATMASLNTSEVAGPAPSLAVAYTNAAIMASILPLPKLAERYFALAGEAIRQTPDRAAESWLLLMEGAYRTWYGQRERAVAMLDRAVVLLQEGAFLRRCDEAECTRIAVDQYAGLNRDSLARIDEVERRSKKRRDRQTECWAILQRAEAMLTGGHPDGALEQVDRVRSLLPTMGRMERIWAAGLETYLRHVRGEDEQAFALGAEAIAAISVGPPVHNCCVNAYDRLAEALIGACARTIDLSQRRLPAAARERIALARRACAIVERAARVFPIVAPAAALHRGTLELLLGRRAESNVVRAWRDAAGVAQRLGQLHRELRLNMAIVSRLDDSKAERAARRARVTELRALLDLGEPAVPLVRRTSPSARLAELRGGVQVEG